MELRVRPDVPILAGAYGHPMPTGNIKDITRHSFPSTPFESSTVLDAMRLGVVSCPADTTLREVARIMATYRIHAVVVAELPQSAPLGVIADIDVAAAADTPNASAGTVARTEVLKVSPEDSLESAARLMAEHDVTHLIVVQPHSGQPVGILSALDVAGALAWGGTV